MTPKGAAGVGKKQQKMFLFAGFLCLVCVSMSSTFGILASTATEEDEEDEKKKETSNTTPLAKATASTPGGDCVGAWSEFGDCSQECSYNDSKGTQSRTYAITTEAGDDGTACPHTDGEEEKKECGMTACTPMDCVGDWDAWKVQGTNQTRDWTITQEPKYGGAECDVAESARTESKACTDATACPPVNCVGSWVNVGSCSATCGPDGKQQKRYDVSTPTSGVGGTACSNTDGDTKEESCNTDKVCAVDCVGGYGNWSSCSETCGPGTKRRTYSVTKPRAGTGTACAKDDGYEETADCEEKPCDQDCEGYWLFDSSGRSKSAKGSNYRTMKWVETKAKSGTGKDCMWAFARESPKIGATDVTRNHAGYINRTADKWTSEVVTNGQKGEHFSYWNAPGGAMDLPATGKHVKYCMRHPNVNNTQNILEKRYIYTTAYGNEFAYVACDEED